MSILGCVCVSSLVLICLLFMMNRCEDANMSSRSFYKTYQEALKNSGVEKSWIHDFVPEDAYEIKEWHYLSPEDQELSFKFSDSKAFKYKIHAYRKYDKKLGELRPKKISKDQVKWLPGNIDPTDFYQMPDFYQTSCLMIDWLAKKAYFSSNCVKKCEY